ncbi:MAG: chemotaxis protein CheY [Verrucomicrobia bacterium]|jgi:two-component system alkaline phosphatase synthesis response regulator PhoP|nr:chemotaxis protein CheY [Verrucomicrobiota bacterium]
MEAALSLPPNPPKALVVEDERDLTTLIAYHLERHGIKTTTAADGEIGLMLATRNQYDIVILDLMLPSLSGLEISRQLHNRMIPSPPVIILTAVSPEIVATIREKLFAEQIIFKPFKPQDLVNCVTHLLKRPAAPEPLT